MASTSSIRTIDQILSEADSRVTPETDPDKPVSFQGIIDQFEEDGTYLSRDMLQLLVYAMYGPDAHVAESAGYGRYLTIDSTFAFMGLVEPLSHLYRQIDFLVKYLEDPSRGDGGSQLIEGFITEIRRTPGVWQTVLPRDEFKRAWQLMSLAIHFTPIKPSLGIKTFRDYFDKTFPKPKTVDALPGFNINLLDILSVDMKIITTNSMNEHLTMEGDTLKLLTISSLNIHDLRLFKNNKAAQALGISSLGEEILYTCQALYGKDQLFQQAETLELLKSDTQAMKVLGPIVLDLAEAKPFVLSERTHKLHMEINRRRSWLPLLMRDIKKQAKSQPFLFYGGALAVFFGILQTVQTITSIWSLVLAIKAQ